MGDNTPWFLVHPREEVPGTNAGMVQDLLHSGSLRSPECTTAFQAIDRQHFWPAEGGKLAYADMPLRSGRLHLSAPHIYAKALESLLPLRPGMSFLNVGSGTGYFNSIISELIGPLATNHGIDIWPETVAHAERCCRALGKHNLEFTVGNVYQLDVNWTMRYDRIYLGACANSRSKYLYRLLEIGGILIGPFQVGHQQQLRRVVRQSETQFNVEVLGSVQFASLIEPVPTTPQRAGLAFAPPFRQGLTRRRTSTPFSVPPPPPPPAGGAAAAKADATQSEAVGLPGVPFSFSLWERPWTPERCWLYPPSYRRTVAMGLLCRPRNPCLVSLPTEIWVKHIFPWCPKWWFEPPSAVNPGMTPRWVPQTPGANPPPMALAPACREDDTDGEVRRKRSDHSSDDDVASTRAPSAGGRSSSNTTPGSGPSHPPTVGSGDVEVDMATPTEEELADAGLIFEVFGNGQRHAIGAEDDPDDMEPEEGPRMVVPLQVLELLAADARRRRRREERDERRARDDEVAHNSLREAHVEQEEDEEEEEVEDEDEELMADQGGRASEDEDMLDAEETMHPIVEDTEAAEMAL